MLKTKLGSKPCYIKPSSMKFEVVVNFVLKCRNSLGTYLVLYSTYTMYCDHLKVKLVQCNQYKLKI